jgi:hypothetical protein
MIKSYVTSAIVGAFVLGLSTLAVAATKGEFGNMCTMGLALHKNISIAKSTTANCSPSLGGPGCTHCAGAFLQEGSPTALTQPGFSQPGGCVFALHSNAQDTPAAVTL